MSQRPLLFFPAPANISKRGKKPGGGGRLLFPSRDDQAKRLGPRFQALQDAFATPQVHSTGLLPEEVVVLEIVGSISNFIRAVQKIEGLEWLGEVETEDIPPDDAFSVPDESGKPRKDKLLHPRLFLVCSNQKGLQQVISLWQSWKMGQKLPRNLGKWADAFRLLRDVRRWGLKDRLLETGVIEDWRERVQAGDSEVACEIELWFRENLQHREQARDRVVTLVHGHGGRVVAQSAIAEIRYSAVLVRLPATAIAPLLDAQPREIELVQCEAIQFFRGHGQMVAAVADGDKTLETAHVTPPPIQKKPPVVALLDGLPLQNHQRLAGRLIIDDPDGHEPRYPANERVHGTAMASLIIHGDLGKPESPLVRPLYVRPILQPTASALRSPRPEEVADDTLVVDLVHRAVTRLFESTGAEPGVAPSVRIISLALGIPNRQFQYALSPLARLLDWLAFKHQILFLVSAGNHRHPIDLAISRSEMLALSKQDLQSKVLRVVAEDSRHRRLLSPAEALNVLTVGAIHGDASDQPPPANKLDPLVDRGLPSLLSAHGMGFRRSVKPDVLFSGGRTLLEEGRSVPSCGLNVVLQWCAPGQKVAAPGALPGDTSYSWHFRGTSGATALATRAAAVLYDVLNTLRPEPGWEAVDRLPRAILLKALIVHAADWGPAASILENALNLPSGKLFSRDRLIRFLGYGEVDVSRVTSCTGLRVTALGGGELMADQAHIYRFPLPPSLSGKHGRRRLIVTLAWLTPVNPQHQSWRRADLWFEPVGDLPLRVKRQQGDWQTVRRGTVQHEIFEGVDAAPFLNETHIEVRVNCREDAGTFEEPVSYALAVTLEVAEEIGIEIYDEIRVRVHAARIQVGSGS